MHESLRLCDASLEVLAEEVVALENNDEEKLIALCEKRAAMMQRAWDVREGCDPSLLCDRLEAIRIAQSTLADSVSRQMEVLRPLLKNKSRQSSCLSGYGKVLGGGLGGSVLYKEG